MTDAAKAAKIKDVAVQLANVAIVNYNDKSLTGEEREHKVCQFLANLTNMIPQVAWIPDELIADVLDAGVDNIQEFYGEDVKPFVKKCFNRIMHILHIPHKD